MKKYQIVIITVVILFSGIIFVSAKDKPDGNPFQAIWNALTNLQEQIDNLGQPQLQLRLKVIDANNDEVGYLVQLQGNHAVVFDINLQKFLSYTFTTGHPEGSIPAPGMRRMNTVFYTSEDCSGTPYGKVLDNNPYLVYEALLGGSSWITFFTIQSYDTPTQEVIVRSENGGGSCFTPSITQTLTLTELTEIQLPEYEPPLQIVEE